MTILGFHSLPELVMFITSLLTGVTMVMGVNAVNSAPSFMLDFYKYIGKDPDATPRYPSFWGNVLNFYTVVTLVAQTVHEPTNLTSFMCRFSLLFRLEMSSLLMLVELLVIVLLPHTGASEVGAMAAIIIVAYLGGAARAYFENTGYALFGPCPSKMLSGMLVGSALSGALVSVIQIILKGAMPDTHEAVLTQSILYFSLSLGIIFVSAVSLIGLLFNPFAKRYIAEFRSRNSPLANIYRPLQDGDKAKYFGNDCDEDPEDNEHSCGAHRQGNLNGDELTMFSGTTPAHLLSTTPNPAAPVPQRDLQLSQQPQQRGGIFSVFSGHDNAEDDVLFDDRVPAREEAEIARGPKSGDAVPLSGGTASANCKRGSEPVGALEPIFLDDMPEVEALSPPHKLADAPQGSCSHGEDDEAIARAEVEALTTSELLQGVRLWPVIKKIYLMMISCLLTFLITYLMYPGILLAVDAEDGWYTTLIMAVYNFGDLIGRAVSMWKVLWPPRKVILIGSIVRVVFIPLLILCAVGTIPGHAPAYVFTALLAVTNGFFGTLSMVYAPETPSLKTDGERAIAGQAIGVCLLLGCSVGSLLQLAEVLPFNK